MNFKISLLIYQKKTRTLMKMPKYTKKFKEVIFFLILKTIIEIFHNFEKPN